MNIQNKFPSGWDESRVRDVIAHYEQQSEDEAVAEAEETLAEQQTVMVVPLELVPAIRELIAKNQLAET